jgi:acetolactate synthase I/II/III large subunit
MKNRLNGADAVVRLLQQHGVRHIFGLCGDTSLPLYDSLARLDHGIEHILTRDERHAGYMADAYARLTNRVGVCEGPSGGGATYILPGVVEANDSSVPLLAITTDISVSGRGKFTLTELDQQALFAPVTKWNKVIDNAGEIPETLRRAFREATTGKPGAVHLGLPFDVQRDSVDDTDIHGDAAFGHVPAERRAGAPDDIARAARLLAEAQRPMFICGGGVVTSGAEAALLQLAERLDAPVATTITGQGAIAETHALAVGVVGSNGGTPETRAVVGRADLIVFLACRAGSVTTERWRYPAPGAAKIVQIDIDSRVIGATYQPDAAIAGDAKLVLEALAGELDGPAAETGARAAIAEAKRAKFQAFDILASSDTTPIRPERLVADLRAVMPDDGVVVVDPGTPCPYFSAYYTLPQSGRHLISNRAHGALGYALPAVIGAQTARPDVPCVAVMGDGSFAMAAGEMETMVRLNLPVTLIVVSNATFGWIRAGQRHGYDSRFFATSFSRTDHARVAEGFGLTARTVTDPLNLRQTLEQAIAHDGPVLVDVICQPLDEANAPVSEWVA